MNRPSSPRDSCPSDTVSDGDRWHAALPAWRVGCPVIRVTTQTARSGAVVRPGWLGLPARRSLLGLPARRSLLADLLDPAQRVAQFGQPGVDVLAGQPDAPGQRVGPGPGDARLD